MAKVIWDENLQADLKNRLSKLSERSQAKWGKMNVAQMLKHMDIAFKNALGEIPTELHPLAIIVSLTPVKHTLIYALPFMKNLMSAPEFQVVGQHDFQQSYEELLESFEKVTSSKDVSNFDRHPLFGRLNKKEWGALLYKHLDHHLQQFGV